MNETLSAIDKMLQSREPGDVCYMLTAIGCILSGDREGAEQLIGAYLFSQKNSIYSEVKTPEKAISS